MFSRTSAGISLSESGIRAVRIRGPLAAPRLEKTIHRPLPPGAIRFSAREPNILDGDAVIGILREIRADLCGRGIRFFLTLPHGAGRVLLMDVEEEFSGRTEGIRVLRWKLGKKLACDGDDLRLDYQQLGTRENGSVTVLVALAFRRVIEQYEEVFAAADTRPARIDFDCFNLCRLFERRLAAASEHALLFTLEASLGMMVFSGGRPVFVRIREADGDRSRGAFLHQEIARSFLSYRDHFPEKALSEVLCVASPHDAPELLGIARDVMGCEPALLETRDAVAPPVGTLPGRDTLFPFSVSIGAALRGV
jgi:Tfp pilus assembly PilM family ATPase